MSAFSKPPRSVVRNRHVDKGEEKRPEPPKKRKTLRKGLKSMSLEELERRQTSKTDIDYTPELYNEILQKWKEDERFKIQDGIICTGNTNIKNMHEFSNTGTKSIVYVLTINDDRQFIIKQNLQGNSIRAEAELQKYAATMHGLAPDVFAYNDTTILMEKCKIIPKFQTNYMNGLHIIKLTLLQRESKLIDTATISLCSHVLCEVTNLTTSPCSSAKFGKYSFII